MKKQRTRKGIVIIISILFMLNAYGLLIRPQQYIIPASSNLLHTEKKQIIDFPLINFFSYAIINAVNIGSKNFIVQTIQDFFTKHDTSNDVHYTTPSSSYESRNSLPLPIINEDTSVQPRDPPAPLDPDDLWWNTDWLNRKKITINHTKIAGTLSNFPVLISLSSDADLADTAQDDGDDIVFTTDTAKQLNHEIEFFDNTTGHLIVWVNITNLSSLEDTQLYLYYGNPTCSSQQHPEDVWDSHFIVVQHLKDATTSTTTDSSINSNDGIKKGVNEPLGISGGKIDDAQDFDGSNDYIKLVDNDGLDHSPGTGFTYSAWIKSDDLSAGYRNIFMHRDTGSIPPNAAVVGLWTLAADLYIEVRNDTRLSQTIGSIGVTLSQNTWYYVCLTRNTSGSIYVWVNTTSYPKGTCTGNITPAQDLYIGSHSLTANQYFNGVIDDFSLSNIQRNNSWILTCFNNQNNPSTFFNVSSEELIQQPMITDELPKNHSKAIELNPLLQATINDFQADPVTWWIKSNCSGTWQVLNSGLLATGSGTVTATPTDMIEYNTTYWWSINATDGTHITNKLYSFTTEQTWLNNSWHIRRLITIHHEKVKSTLTNFPLLISIKDNDFTTHARVDGNDFLFTDEYGHKLNHEIERYNSSSGELVCWVNVTAIYSMDDTVLYMYYGNFESTNQQNSIGVWNSKNKVVFHLDESSGSIQDSSVYMNIGVPSGGLQQNVIGLLDGADFFDGINDQITVSDASSLDFGTLSFTISAWINLTKTATYQAIAEKRNGSNAGFWFNTQSNGRLAACIEDELGNDNQGQVGTRDVCTGSWHYVCAVFDRTENKIVVYVDGSFDGQLIDPTVTGTINTSTSLHIGYYSTFPLNGFIDEIRITETALSSDWINTSYLNQQHPFEFYTVSSKKTSGSGAPYIIEESPVHTSEGICLNPILMGRITDFEDDTVDWTIRSNNSGSWVTINNGTITNGTGVITATPSNMNNYNTTYYWSINSTDTTGSNLWTNNSYNFTTTFAPGKWWNPNWQYRKSILIKAEQVDGNSELTNFPVLIRCIDDDLATHAEFDGDDIVFTTYHGQQLHHEIEFYDGRIGELQAWVNITNLTDTDDTKMYIYYGNPTCDNQEHISDTWNTEYTMIHHLPHNWIPYTENPVLTAGTYASVLKVNDTFHMYYYYAGNTGHATSVDGLTWTPDTVHNPVLYGTELWEGSNADVPWVWKEGATWYMMYRGGNPPVGSDATGLATSSDGLTWTKNPNNPILLGESGKWDAGGAEIWGTIKVNDTYYTYYECYYNGSRHVGVAWSTNLINWTKDPSNPIFIGTGQYDTGLGRFCPCVINVDNYYYMLIPHYTSGTDYSKIELYRDTTPTFHSDSREYLGPIKMVAHPGGWETNDQDTPCVLTDDIYKNSFSVTNNTMWTYYDGAGRTGLLISPSIPQALKGAMRDSTIYENHGDSAGVGGPTEIFGIIGGGITIDGNDEWMVVEDTNSLDITTSFSVECWVKLNTILSNQPNTYAAIIDKKQGATGYGLWFDCDNETLVLSLGSTNFTLNVSGYDWTQWHQVISTYDGTYVKIYIDTTRVTSVLFSELIPINNQNIWIGDLVHNSGNTLDGSIDEIRISNAARTWEWINTSYHTQYNPMVFSLYGDEEPAPLLAWETKITFTGPDELHDWVIFAEARDASDGQDYRDVPKPSTPPAPYISAWFDANLSEPYNRLWKDYRLFPDDTKIWDLYVRWENSGPDNITLEWNPNNLTRTEYAYMILHDVDLEIITDMLTNGQYSYLAEDGILHHFQIIASMEPFTVTYKVLLSDEWNFVSFPVNKSVEKTAITVSSSGNNYSWQDAVTAGIILNDIYGWSPSLRNYYISSNFTPGDGYWVYAYEESNLSITTTAINVDEYITSLRQEWNLVSIPFSTSVNKLDLMVTYNDTEYTWSNAVLNHIILDSIYGWDPQIKNYVISTIVDPGTAYWMYAYEDCILKKGE